jgi:hypothetical protein
MQIAEQTVYQQFNRSLGFHVSLALHRRLRETQRTSINLLAEGYDRTETLRVRDPDGNHWIARLLGTHRAVGMPTSLGVSENVEFWSQGAELEGGVHGLTLCRPAQHEELTNVSQSEF